MIWTPNQIIGCRFENSPNNANGDTFTEVGAVSYEDGPVGRQLDISAANAYVEMGNNYVGPKYHGAEAITISGWYTPTANIARGDCFYTVMFNRAAINISMRNLSLRVSARSISSEGGGALEYAYDFQLHETAHVSIIISFSGKYIRSYVNGQFYDEATGLGFSSNTYQHTNPNDINRIDTIGADMGGGNINREKIDELRVWKKEISPSDLKRVYHGLHPLNG